MKNTISIPTDPRDKENKLPMITNEMKASCIGEFSWSEEAPYYNEDGEIIEHVAERVVPDYVTVVYEIVNQEDWGKTNPLHYAHNGLKAVGVSYGDLMERIEKIERMCDENDIDISV